MTKGEFADSIRVGVAERLYKSAFGSYRLRRRWLRQACCRRRGSRSRAAGSQVFVGLVVRKDEEEMPSTTWDKARLLDCDWRRCLRVSAAGRQGS